MPVSVGKLTFWIPEGDVVAASTVKEPELEPLGL
jgi:hypothetical protein